MKIFGIIAEFNPFHNGHKYLIETIRQLYEPDIVIAVMSSSFVQRGEPSMLSKWDRAKIALENGINIVLELPFVYSCQNAEVFASGAVKILNGIGITDLFFGTEADSIDKLESIARIMADENPEIQKTIKEYLNIGTSYIYARNQSYLDLNKLNENDIELISKPNNILALEYIRNTLKINDNINFISIKRRNVNHDSKLEVDQFTSASNIRKKIKTSQYYSNFVPYNIDEYKVNKGISNKILYKIFKFDILDSTKYLMKTIDYENGLENRIFKFLDKAKNLEELAQLVSNKRITKARIRRMTINSLIRVSKEDLALAYNSKPYIRILGLDLSGREYIRNTKTNYITNFKEIKKASSSIQRISNIEKKATNLYSIINSESINKDFLTKPIII